MEWFYKTIGTGDSGSRVKNKFNHVSFVAEDEDTRDFQSGNDLLNTVLSALQSEGFTKVLDKVHEPLGSYYRLANENESDEGMEAVVYFNAGNPRESLVLKHAPGAPDNVPTSQQNFEIYLMELIHARLQGMLKEQEALNGEAHRKLHECPWTQNVKTP